jgi:hypothetical protein
MTKNKSQIKWNETGKDLPGLNESVLIKTSANNHYVGYLTEVNKQRPVFFVPYGGRIFGQTESLSPIEIHTVTHWAKID